MANKKSTSEVTRDPHPDHAAQQKRISRIRGQIEGIERMVSERRYCVDIIHQIKAARSALNGLETAIIETHLRECVRSAINSKDAFKSEEKIQEILKILS